MKTKIILLLMCCMLIFSTALNVYAGGQGNKGCRKSKGLKEKFFHKAKMIYKNQMMLGLSDEQIEKIKALKVKTKKELIKKQADIDILKVDIKASLYQQKIDLDAVNKLIDKKYDHKKAKAKMLVKAINDLKSILTDEQYAKLKQLYFCSKGGCPKGTDSKACAVKKCGKCNMSKANCKCK